MAEKDGSRRLQKTRRDGAVVTWRGSSFQTRAAATGKARSLAVDNRVRRTMMTLSEDDLKPRGPTTGGTRQRGMVAQSHANIGTSARFSFSHSV